MRLDTIENHGDKGRSHGTSPEGLKTLQCGYFGLEIPHTDDDRKEYRLIAWILFKLNTYVTDCSFNIDFGDPKVTEHSLSMSLRRVHKVLRWWRASVSVRCTAIEEVRARGSLRTTTVMIETSSSPTTGSHCYRHFCRVHTSPGDEMSRA